MTYLKFWQYVQRARHSTSSKKVGASKHPASLQYFPLKHPPTRTQIVRLRRHLSLSKLGSDTNEAVSPAIYPGLKPIEKLLSMGKHEEALEKCIEFSDSLQTLPISTQQQYFHFVMSMFTFVMDFQSAVAITNFMIHRNVQILPTTLMMLLRRWNWHDPRYHRQLRRLFLTDHVSLDDKSVEGLMTLMLMNEWPADCIEEFLSAYRRAQVPTWCPSRLMVGTLIRAYATTGHIDQAESLLNKYRQSDEWWPSNATSATTDLAFSSVKSFAEASYGGVPSDMVVLESVVRKASREENGLSSSPFPYAALLKGYGLSETPIYNKVDALLSFMDQDHIIPDIVFCNGLLDTYVRWRSYDKAFSVYKSMLRLQEFPLPDSQTYRKLAVLLRKLEEEAGDLTSSLQSPRDVFRHFMIIHGQVVSIMNVSSGIASLETQNSFLSTFVRYKDYAGAMVILRLYSDFQFQPTENTRLAVELSLAGRVHKEGNSSWRIRFLGEDTGLNYQVQHFRRFARPPRPLSPERMELWFMHEILGRALLADMGHTVKWAKRGEDMNTISAEARAEVEELIQAAMREMMPAADLRIERVDEDDNVAMSPQDVGARE